MVLDAPRFPSRYSVTAALKSQLPGVVHLPLMHAFSPRFNRFPVRPRWIRTPLNTLEPPQTLSHHVIAHTFRRTWGVPSPALFRPVTSLLFHSIAAPRSPLAPPSPHSNACKSIPFMPLLHSSLYTRVGVSSVFPSRPKPRRNVQVLPLCMQSFANTSREKGD
jgi:hypothetical protein